MPRQSARFDAAQATPYARRKRGATAVPNHPAMRGVRNPHNGRYVIHATAWYVICPQGSM